MDKTYRRHIRINGVVRSSPRFATKKEADDWFQDQAQQKRALRRSGRAGSSPTFLEQCGAWLRQLTVDYEPPTWKGYEANVRLHLLPYLADYKVDEITRAKCREVLMNVTRNGFSVSHRKHVQATLSKFFTDCMNQDPPIRDDNPVYRMKFDGKRTSKKFIPATIEHHDDVLEFLAAARDISDQHFVLACLGLMAALRKSEMIALRWRSVRWRTNEIRISARYRDAMHTITAGTKSGEDVSRDVPVPETLIEVLRRYRGVTPFRLDEHFILCKPDGTHWKSRAFHDRFVEIRTRAGRPDLTLHSLRHTYGRHFAAKTGNLKALQTVLGHVSPATTAIYAELAATQVKPLTERMGFEISDRNDATDAKLTPRK